MVTVVLPWRPQPSRIAAFEVVRDWYAEALPEAEIRTIDSPDPVFNLAQCRNLGVAALADDEVAVIGDADTLPQREPLLAAIEAARTSGRVHLPYTEYRWLGSAGTAQAAAGTPLERCEFELVRGACSGVYVTRASSWQAHGGQDERFRGWGFEDAAWYLAHTTLLGEPPRRHEGMVFALHHQAEVREGPQYDANAALMQRYRDASVGADAMRAVVFGG
ncbi:hypothetical protein [Frigoribacterium sp. VKM Ac-2836]|uniref:hypothetical protein n=1 Tax=Frigoribacterium sp. VKM Ac-2836 TaxID=2739014 RepID=UPI001565A97C|nr:hypothetical protein [Frigoribacterium sp. VKM Ac-2836]NRD27790.1 hypothetical protein [Frigoribacterium sp. VKM Ac-2836]